MGVASACIPSVFNGAATMYALRLKTKSTLAEHILIELDAKSRCLSAGPLNVSYNFKTLSNLIIVREFPRTQALRIYNYYFINIEFLIKNT